LRYKSILNIVRSITHHECRPQEAPQNGKRRNMPKEPVRKSALIRYIIPTHPEAVCIYGARK
jgi:hypothetical protein